MVGKSALKFWRECKWRKLINRIQTFKNIKNIKKILFVFIIKIINNVETYIEKVVFFFYGFIKYNNYKTINYILIIIKFLFLFLFR